MFLIIIKSYQRRNYLKKYILSFNVSILPICVGTAAGLLVEFRNFARNLIPQGVCDLQRRPDGGIWFPAKREREKGRNPCK